MKYISTQNKTKTIVYLLILLIIGITGFLNSSPGGGFIWPPPLTTHSSSVSEVWTISDIYINRSNQPLILALDGKLIILGSDDSKKRSNIIALDADTGRIVWRVNYDGFVIAASASNVIVGGVGQVMALNNSNGKTLWKTYILTNVNEITVQDNLIYIVGAASSRYYVLDAITGKVLQKNNGESPVHPGNNIELWRTNADIISNLAVTPSFVYAIDLNDNIIRLNSTSGSAINTFVEFKSSPPLLSSPDYNSLTYSYYVAVDAQSNNLFVYLGDSAQLFAYKLSTSQ